MKRLSIKNSILSMLTMVSMMFAAGSLSALASDVSNIQLYGQEFTLHKVSGYHNYNNIDQVFVILYRDGRMDITYSDSEGKIKETIKFNKIESKYDDETGEMIYLARLNNPIGSRVSFELIKNSNGVRANLRMGFGWCGTGDVVVSFSENI